MRTVLVPVSSFGITRLSYCRATSLFVTFVSVSIINYSDNGFSLHRLVFIKFASFSFNPGVMVLLSWTTAFFILLTVVPIRLSKHTVSIPFKRHSFFDHLLLLFDVPSEYDGAPF
jgi:hypothetical protein